MTHLPLLALHGLVEAPCIVTGNEAHELVEKDGGGEQGSTRRRTEHAQHGEEDGDGEHGEDLDPRPDHRRKQPGQKNDHIVTGISIGRDS